MRRSYRRVTPFAIRRPAREQPVRSLWPALTLWSRGVVDHPTKEVARLRNARVTGCGFCRNVRFDRAREEGLGEERVEMIDDGFRESHLSDRHKVVIRYTGVFLADPFALPDDLRAEMLRLFAPEEIVEIAAGLSQNVRSAVRTRTTVAVSGSSSGYRSVT